VEVSYEFVWLRGCVENGLLRKVPYLGCVAESGSVALSRAESGLASAIAYYGFPDLTSTDPASSASKSTFCFSSLIYIGIMGFDEALYLFKELLKCQGTFT
jgi:hypothetical protein